MDYPSWNTQSNLGTYSQDTSFDLSPITISFSAGSGTGVYLINGSLPAGLSWTRPPLNNNILITGVVSPQPDTINSRFTFRLIQPNGSIADRTFSLSISPLPVLPSWELQDRFLGYQSNIGETSYQLTAIPPPGDHVVYSIVTPSAGSMTVNSITGLLTYNANVITSNYTASFNVRASTNTASSDIDLSIDVLAPPFEPTWITSAGALNDPSTGSNEFIGNKFIEIQLEATDVTGAGLIFTLEYADPGFPLQLSSTGLLYGNTVNPIDTIVYGFTVRASSINGYSDRYFTITLVPSELANLLIWVTQPDLGTINEGQYVDIRILAETQRNTQITYSVTGGLLPPHLMMEVSGGHLVGFCEYHAINKTYYFEVQADDGFQKIIRQFKIEVNNSYGDQFFGAYIPLIGEMRSAWNSDVSNVKAREPGTVNVYQINNIVEPPYLSIIDGVITGYDTPAQIIDQARPWIHSLDLQLGPVGNSAADGSGISTLYRTVNCFQEGASVQVYSQPVYNTNAQMQGMVYPINIENLRQALSSNRSFVGGGSGSGVALSPVIDWSDGGIDDVIILDSGRGYRSKPSISVTGSGQGAVLDPILGLASAIITDTGQGWQVGDTVEVPGNAPTTPANVLVTSVGTNGSAATIEIIDPGDYLQVGAVPRAILKKGSASMVIEPTWGVTRVDVVSKGQGYQCGINLNTTGGEILPSWQAYYFPAMEIGTIPVLVSNHAAEILNYEDNSMWGDIWLANYMVFQWQGIRWLGTTTFDDSWTTFDGRTTNFQETEDPRVTVFDEELETFDQGATVFDYRDPLEYDFFQVWGGTLIDAGTTAFDLYSTIFDQLSPRKTSVTMVRKWITMQHEIYSGNNAVW